METSLSEIAEKTGASLFDVNAAANQFRLLGFCSEKVLQATAAVMGIVRACQIKREEAVEGLIAASVAFSKTNNTQL